MRVFLLKVTPKRWTLYIDKTEYFNSGLDIESVSTSGNSQQQSKFTQLLNKIKLQAIESRQEIENATYGVGLKGKLKSLLHSLENRIHPEESILQQFSKINDKNIMIHHHQNHHHHGNHIHNNHHGVHYTRTSHSENHSVFQELNDKHERPSFQIFYPSDIGNRRAKRYAQIFVQQRERYHKIWMVINTLLIPFTMAATIVPGPNIFLAYNLYRLYGHYQALNGCKNFQKYTKSHGNLLFKPSLEISECLSNSTITNETTTILSEKQPLIEEPTTTTATNEQKEKIQLVLPNNNIYSMNFNRLSTNLKIPGLFDFIKKIENTEK
ncbi:hypothetical protein DLAC_02770 [Tieghemostelium lacteum]|uniref:Transmembrane protein n=1 Tax=Tieghemostelium lacteum TaxID=361077 RepID=A0A152A3E3_TIELA|nr:hypothetical protein DLAC_02770 [Tieghemostelium lacteum]|eukprot:KYR00729.1 hypothetical protein DLAC_02770 [Tieghemostelium lacteum]